MEYNRENIDPLIISEPEVSYDPVEEQDLEETDKYDISEPFDPKLVDIQVSQTTMDTLIKRLKHNEIDLMPDFQRNANLWKTDTMGRLIESLLMRFPLPAFYFDATDENKWLVVDGLQRLITLRRFVIEKNLKLKGLEFLHDKFNNSLYDGLPRAMQRRIEEAPVTLYLIKPGTPPEVKYSIFHRINTGGLRLNAQEIRHALNQSVGDGRASKFLNSIVESAIFKKVVGVSGKRMLDKELVLRQIAFRFTEYKDYKAPMINFLNKAMAQLGNLNDSELKKHKLEFENSLNLSWALFGDNAFRKSLIDDKKRKVLNRALFEVFTVLFSELDKDERQCLINKKEPFVSEFKEMLAKEDFLTIISYSTTDPKNVTKRFDKISDIILKYKSHDKVIIH